MAGLRKYLSLYSSTSNSFGTGEAVTITPASVVGLPTTPIVLTFDRVASDGVTLTPTKMERIKGSVSGGNFVVASGGRGYDGSTAQAHTSPVVEMIWNAADWNDSIDALTNLVNVSTGALDTTKVVDLATAQTLTNKTLTSPVLTTPTINIGSDAQGDIYYRNAAGVFTRLAPGTSGWFLKTQGAAADPIWAAISAMQYSDVRHKVTAHTYDTATASGTQTLTGAGFTPTGATLYGVYNGSLPICLGTSDGTNHHSIYSNGAANNFSYDPSAIYFVMTTGNYVKATLAFNADGGVLTWTKTGTPSGTVNFYVKWDR